MKVRNGRITCKGVESVANRGMTRKEANRRRTRYMVLEGMGDFVGTIASFIIILACIVLLTTLFTWLRGDLPQVIDSLTHPFLDAFG